MDGFEIIAQSDEGEVQVKRTLVVAKWNCKRISVLIETKVLVTNDESRNMTPGMNFENFEHYVEFIQNCPQELREKIKYNLERNQDFRVRTDFKGNLIVEASTLLGDQLSRHNNSNKSNRRFSIKCDEFAGTIINYIKKYFKPKQGGTMAGPGQGQTGPGMPDPINALQNLASQGSRNPMMNMGPQPGQMGGPPQQPTATNLLQTLNRGPGQQMMMGSMPGNMPGNMPMQDRQAIGMPPGGGPMAPNQIGNQMANEMRIQQMRNTGINQMPNQLTGHVTNQMQSPVQNQICGQMPGQIPGQMQMGNTMASQIQSQMMEVTEVHNSEKEKPKETISSEQLNKNTTKQCTIDPSPGCSYKDENSSQVLVEKIDSDNPQKEEVRRFLKSLEPKKKRARKTVSPSKIQTPSGEKNENLETEKTDQLLQQLVEKEDTTIKFAKYIAEKLNQFNSETKAILTHKINLLIFEAEVKPGSISSNTCSCVFNQPSTSSFVPVTSNGQITNSLRSAPSSLYNETPNPLQIIPPPPPPPPNNNHIPNMLPTPVYSSPNIQTHSKLQLSPYVHVSNALPTTPLPVYNTQATTASRSVPILSSNIQTTSATPMPTPPKIRPVSTLQLMSVRPPSLLDTIPLPLSITPTQNTFQSKPHTSELQSPLNSLNIQIPTTLHSASPLSHDNQDPSPMDEVSTVTPDYPSPSLSPSSHSTNSIRSIYSSVVHSSPEVPFSSPSMSPTSNPSTPCSPSEIISVD